MNNTYLDIAPEVKKALKEGKPVVALESTIISHGMPYPQNVETAKEVESIIRKNGGRTGYYCYSERPVKSRPATGRTGLSRQSRTGCSKGQPEGYPFYRIIRSRRGDNRCIHHDYSRYGRY